jgi:hypothetical protein
MKQAANVFPGVFTTLLLALSVAYSVGNLALPVSLFGPFAVQIAVFGLAMVLAGYFIGQINRRLSHKVRWPFDLALMVLTAGLFSWIAIFIIHWFFMNETVPATSADHRRFVGYCVLASAVAVAITFAMLYRRLSVFFVVSFLGVFLLGHMMIAVLYMEGRLL